MDYIFQFKVLMSLGILIIIIVIWKLIIKKKKTATSYFEESRSFHKSKNELKSLTEKAFLNLKFKNIYFDEEDSSFSAKTRMSIYSWSEYVTVKLSENGNFTEVDFKSKCALPTQIIDWGKNKRNSKKFFKNLESK